MNTELFNSADDHSTKHGVCLPAHTQSFYLDVFKMSFLIGFIDMIERDLRTAFFQYENMFTSCSSVQMNWFCFVRMKDWWSLRTQINESTTDPQSVLELCWQMNYGPLFEHVEQQMLKSCRDSSVLLNKHFCSARDYLSSRDTHNSLVFLGLWWDD